MTYSRTLKRLPLLQPEKLKGGIVYHDGQFDDSRMAIALAGSCVERGGNVLNYFRVNGFIKDEKGKISGVKAENLETRTLYNLNAKLVINATGVFADEIHRMDNPEAKPTIRPSQGVHIVLDNSFLQSQTAIMIPKTDDGRVLFAIPWYGKVVAGTTDTPLDKITLEPKALNEEIDFILRTAGRYLVKPPSRKDVLCIYAGLRPLAANPDNPSATREVSRRHKITISASGLLSIIGGKWTSYRRMAEETIDRAIRAGMLEKKKCLTKEISLFSPDPALHRERLKIYGSKAVEIEKLMCGQPSMGEPLNPNLPYTKAEIVWICRNEMPRTLEDMLARRTRSLFLDVNASIAIAPRVADIMAEELGYDSRWKEQQLEAYNKLTLNYL
jgi:glycerol-3-phosphate dehydrogenase